jgi:hypothetical protein
MMRVILTIALRSAGGCVARLVPQAASGVPKVVILIWTTPVWAQTTFRSEPSATMA